ncbi:MAG: small ribosomal subunit biogenesis GTPase RsgA [Legionella sp.]
MSKRRINKQQSARIHQKQQIIQNEPRTNTAQPVLTGLVITRYGRHVQIESENNHRIHCSIRPNLLNSLVAGDNVLWQPEGIKQGVVISCLPRKSILGRSDKKSQVRPIAANISQLMIVVAAKPQISWTLLDSYLVAAEYLQLQACIVLNKIDIAEEELQLRLYSDYHSLGYKIILTALNHAQGLLALEKVLENQISVFVGQSGVGKSSLIASILPSQNIQTGAISLRAELGCHTTSNSVYYHLPNGGALIDSPGIREFGLWHMPARELAKGFREFKPHLERCKYRNCNHLNDPGCAIHQAIEDGKISTSRYQNYVKICAQFAK